MFAKLKRALLMLWAVLSALVVIVGVILLRKSRREIQQGIEENAENERERAKEKIENTSASELVAASGNADALCRERRAAENVSVKDLVPFPSLQVSLTENLEKNEIRRRSKSICFAYVILKWFPYNQQRVFVRKLGRAARTICVFKSHLCSPPWKFCNGGGIFRRTVGKASKAAGR